MCSSSSSSSSSSSVVGQIRPQHQVFINFRGKQMRKGFVSFLVPALRKENINVFIDETEIRSRDLQHIFKRIEESSVAVVIFSELYTESEWCLNELVKINERMIEGKLKVIPIFFKVTVGNVKIREGEFGIHFRETKRKYQGKSDIIRNWEKALNSIPQKFGFTSSKYRTEYDLVNAIVQAVKKLLNHIPEEEAAAAKENRYRKAQKAPTQTKKRVIDYNSQVPNKVTNFTITQIRKMLIQRSTQMSRIEERDNVPLASLNWKQKKRKNDGEEILVWKPEDIAQPIGEMIRFSGEGEEKKYHYEKFKFDGKQYGLEDSVLIIPAVPNRKLYAAIIKDIYKQEEDYMYLEVQWFYRLEDAEKKDGGHWESRDSRILFYSFHREEMFAEFVEQKCDVHFVPGDKQIPKLRQHPGFIVQNVYDFVNKKLWKLTDQDFEEEQKHEIDLLVATTMLRLGDLPDIPSIDEITAGEEPICSIHLQKC